MKKEKQKRVLLHVCCAPCATASIERIKKEYSALKLVLFYYNPNIMPQVEWKKRKDELKRFVKLAYPHTKIICPRYQPKQFIELARGREQDKEGGMRCQLCIDHRLKKTSDYAKKHGYDYFTTTLTISPHKSSPMIFDLAQKFNSNKSQFLAVDFKKREGFKRSVELCKQYNIYRQSYCGCLFSQNIQTNA